MGQRNVRVGSFVDMHARPKLSYPSILTRRYGSLHVVYKGWETLTASLLRSTPLPLHRWCLLVSSAGGERAASPVASVGGGSAERALAARRPRPSRRAGAPRRAAARLSASF